MMGQHDRSEALFYYFRLEDQVPETHLLRLIEKHISFAFVREKLKESYSETGRPSIDPELLLRILLIGYLYGITSERKLVEELRMHLAWRWFTGLGFDQEIPHHSTFSKNRHGRFQESKLFEQLFERIVKQCVEVGLVRGQELSVDGSFVEANAAKESRIPREQLESQHAGGTRATLLRSRTGHPAAGPSGDPNDLPRSNRYGGGRLCRSGHTAGLDVSGSRERCGQHYSDRVLPRARDQRDSGRVSVHVSARHRGRPSFSRIPPQDYRPVSAPCLHFRRTYGLGDRDCSCPVDVVRRAPPAQ